MRSAARRLIFAVLRPVVFVSFAGGPRMVQDVHRLSHKPPALPDVYDFAVAISFQSGSKYAIC